MDLISIPYYSQSHARTNTEDTRAFHFQADQKAWVISGLKGVIRDKRRRVNACYDHKDYDGSSNHIWKRIERLNSEIIEIEGMIETLKG